MHSKLLLYLPLTVAIDDDEVFNFKTPCVRYITVGHKNTPNFLAITWRRVIQF